MAKKVRAIIKLQIEAGKATPAPPVGPALGQHGVNIMGFVKEYNERTAQQAGSIVPVYRKEPARIRSLAKGSGNRKGQRKPESGAGRDRIA